MVLFDDNTKKEVLSWLKDQGISTLLLISILAFIGYGVVVLVPSHILMIQEGYEKNAATLSKSLEKLAESHDKDRDMFMRMVSGKALKD
jgi:hypothetical protein